MAKVKIVLLGIGVLAAIFVIVQFINAAKYEMVVNVVEGENVLGLNPTTERLDFGDLSRNNGIARQISIENGGRAPKKRNWGKNRGIKDINAKIPNPQAKAILEIVLMVCSESKAAVV